MGAESASDEAMLDAGRVSLHRALHNLGLVRRILSPGLEDDLVLLSVVCRLLDDTVAQPDESGALAELDRLEGELCASRQPRPIVEQLRARLKQHRVDPAMFRYVIAGLRRDLQPAPLANDEEFLTYSYHVAGVLSVVLGAALGGTRRRSIPYALDFGIALHISGVVRDWQVDARRNCCYLPARRLTPYGLSSQRIIAAADDPAMQASLRPALEGLLRLGDTYYRSAERAIGDVPRRYRHGMQLLSRLYRREGWCSVHGRRPGRGPLTLPPWDRAVVMAQAALLTATPRMWGLMAPGTHDWRLHRAFQGYPGTDRQASDDSARLPGEPRRWRRRRRDEGRRVW